MKPSEVLERAISNGSRYVYGCPECGLATVASSGFSGNPFCWGICSQYFDWDEVGPRIDTLQDFCFKTQNNTDFQYGGACLLRTGHSGPHDPRLSAIALAKEKEVE